MAQTKEQKYAETMKRLGIYDPAFEATIHQLAILEREQSRTRKAWKKSAEGSEEPAMLDRLYAVILQQDKQILTLRESLGLTPKALKRFRAEFGAPVEDEPDEKPSRPARGERIEMMFSRPRAPGPPVSPRTGRED